MGQTASETVNAFMQAMGEGPAGAQTLTELLAEDFLFRGPMLSADSRTEFLEGMQGMAAAAPHFTLLQQVTHGDDVCSIYEMRMGGAGANPVTMAEWTRVREGQLAAQWLVYDADVMRSAME